MNKIEFLAFNYLQDNLSLSFNRNGNIAMFLFGDKISAIDLLDDLKLLFDIPSNNKIVDIWFIYNSYDIKYWEFNKQLTYPDPIMYQIMLPYDRSNMGHFILTLMKSLIDIFLLNEVDVRKIKQPSNIRELNLELIKIGILATEVADPMGGYLKFRESEGRFKDRINYT